MALPLAGKTSRIEVRRRADLQALRRDHAERDAPLRRRGEARRLEVLRRSCAGPIVSPGKILVEGDASSASYFLAAGAIGGGPVRVEGVGRDSIQGDVRFTEVLEKMGAQVSLRRRLDRSSPEWQAAKPIDLDLNHIPDAAMTAAVLALFADGPSTIRNIGSWRVKETDRIAAMATELRKLGAQVEEGADFLQDPRPGS